MIVIDSDYSQIQLEKKCTKITMKQFIIMQIYIYNTVFYIEH